MLPIIVSFFLSFPHILGLSTPPVSPIQTPTPVIVVTTPSPSPTLRSTPSPTAITRRQALLTPKPSLKPTPIAVFVPQPTQNSSAVTPSNLFSALNDYRAKNGQGSLAWDDKLGSYAKERADYFKSKGDIDSHAGFSDFIKNQNGFATLGFNSLGENSSHGGMTSASDIIEKVYAQSSFHNQNMLSSDWSHVGIGASGIFTNFVFGGKKR